MLFNFQKIYEFARLIFLPGFLENFSLMFFMDLPLPHSLCITPRRPWFLFHGTFLLSPPQFRMTRGVRIFPQGSCEVQLPLPDGTGGPFVFFFFVVGFMFAKGIFFPPPLVSPFY